MYTHLKVLTRKRVTNNGDGEEGGGQYSYRGTTHTEWDIQGIALVDPKKHYYQDIAAAFEIEPGKVYFLVYVVYSTGDSFGRDNGAGIEYIGIYKSAEKAMATTIRIGKFQENPEKKKLFVTREDNSIDEIYVPWNGYFETFDYVKMEPVQLKEIS